MKFLRDRHTFVTGNFGSGKTEVAVNLSRLLAREGTAVTLGDLDVVNPYFRCREAAAELEGYGVRVIIPREGYFHADLPIVLPELKGAMLSDDRLFIGDVGGDDVGARILGSFAGALAGRVFDVLIVLNANRPFTDTPAGCERVIAEIEAAARLKMTGIASNAHLMDETDLDTIRRGFDLASEVSESMSIPFLFLTAPERLADEAKQAGFGIPVLPIERTMLPPWRRRGEKVGRDNFRL